MATSQRVDVTTIAEQIKGEEVNIFRDNKFLALYQEKGLITFNHRGKRECEWDLRIRINKLHAWDDGNPQNMPRVQRHVKMALPWRAYRAGESYGELERLQVGGEESRIDFIANTAQYLMDDVKEDFAPKFFIDGNDADHTGDIHGMLSWAGYTNAATKFLAPNDSYAGQSTVLGALGGAAISGTWPDGEFDRDYDAHSPLFVNYMSDDWGNSPDDWTGNCVDALRSGIIHNKSLRGSTQGSLDAIFTTPLLYEQFLNALDDKEQLNVQRGTANSQLISLGFGDVVNFDGVDITHEAFIPSGYAIGMKYDQCEIRSLTGQLFMPSEGFEHETLNKEYSVLFAGNHRANVRGFVFWVAGQVS